MERNNKISIPEPCHEDWNKMTPSENGRFCMSCSKTVVDFSSTLPEEMQHFFIQNQNDKICGRFRNSQLETITIQIPNRVLYTQTNYYKMFLLALFIAMGTTLFSCQNKEGQKQKIDKIEVVTDTIIQHKTIGITVSKENISSSNDSKDADKSSKSTENVIKKSEKSINKKKSSLKEPIYVTGEVVSETNAEFPGGIDQFYNYFAKEFKRPENLETNKIKLSFAVEKNGSVTYLESVPAIDKTLENEIIRVLKSCPKWVPGQSEGKNAKKQYSLPITLE